MNVERSLRSLSSANPFLFYSPSRVEAHHMDQAGRFGGAHKDASGVSLS